MRSCLSAEYVPHARKLLRTLEPAMRTYRALSSTETTNFAEMKLDNYFSRWRVCTKITIARLR